MGFFERRRHFVGVVELGEGLVGVVGADKQDIFGKRGYAGFFSFVGFGPRKIVVHNRAGIAITALQTACDGAHPVVVHGRGKDAEFVESGVGDSLV